MARSPVGKRASDEECKHILNILEQIGKKYQPINLKASFENLPSSIQEDNERLTRFLLLSAILDQQASSPTARATALNIFNIYGSKLFDSPEWVLKNIDKTESIKQEYKISPAIGRVMPR